MEGSAHGPGGGAGDWKISRMLKSTEMDREGKWIGFVPVWFICGSYTRLTLRSGLAGAKWRGNARKENQLGRITPTFTRFTLELDAPDAVMPKRKALPKSKGKPRPRGVKTGP